MVFQLQFGEKFTVDCQDCICLEGEYGIVCEPHKCDQKKVTCDGEGFYEVTEVNPKDSCCPLHTCSKFILFFSSLSITLGNRKEKRLNYLSTRDLQQGVTKQYLSSCFLESTCPVLGKVHFNIAMIQCN